MSPQDDKNGEEEQQNSNETEASEDLYFGKSNLRTNPVEFSAPLL